MRRQEIELRAERDPDPSSGRSPFVGKMRQALLELGRAAGEHGGNSAFGVEVVEKAAACFTPARRAI